MPNLVGIGLSQVPTNSMLGGLAYQSPDHASIKDLDLKNLSQINSEIADTAVDIFIYDTSKDSDGGAWRKRTQHTSWYNETLGTATRGTRREFPAVAVLVLTSTSLTIYDGDDPDLPMWMVFTLSNNYILRAPGASCFAILNAKLVVGDDTNYSGSTIDFIMDGKDATRDLRQVGWGGNIADRNTDKQTTFGSTLLIGTYVKDVAMTVLPNAPIDSATGLPVPTIAVGTNSGTSIIRDDGSVADLTGFSPVQTIHIDGSNVIGSTISGDHDFIFKTHIPSSDESYNAGIIASSKYYYMNSNSGSTPLLRDINVACTEYDSKNGTTYRGGVYGLDIIAPGQAISNNSSKVAVAYATTSYNTGYMVGDIKGAFLSDTDTTNLSGGNKVTNGDSWSGAQSSQSSTAPTGWTGGNGATWKTETGGDGSYIRLYNENNGGDGPNSYMYQAITTVSGRRYKISVTQYHHATISVYFRAGTSINGSELTSKTWTSSSSNTPRYNQGTFTATGTTTYITLGIVSGTHNYSVGWDDVVVTEVDEDRSVNANGLHSYGTITKSAVATGAELVAYSTGSNGTYLEQPYNSDLDYGTGDMYYSMWVYANSSDTFSGNTYIFERSSISDSSNRRIEARMTTSTRLEIYSNGQTLDNNVPVPANAWYKLDIVRRSGEAFVYINGEYHSSTTGGAAIGSLTDTSAKLVIGNRAYFADRNYAFPSNSKIALFRTGASAPSAEQIKKIYEDEKFLFQENAKCTLYGSSDAVTALAYDEVTDRLHVGTSSGRSDFQGLRRINNTTTAVTTAISAHDEFIVEQ